jgi:hypothetical protein
MCELFNECLSIISSSQNNTNSYTSHVKNKKTSHRRGAKGGFRLIATSKLTQEDLHLQPQNEEQTNIYAVKYNIIEEKPEEEKNNDYEEKDHNELNIIEASRFRQEKQILTKQLRLSGAPLSIFNLTPIYDFYTCRLYHATQKMVPNKNEEAIKEYSEIVENVSDDFCRI